MHKETSLTISSWTSVMHLHVSIIYMHAIRCKRWSVKTGLKITAGHRTMSGQDDNLSGQNFGLAVILTGHVHSFQINNLKVLC